VTAGQRADRPLVLLTVGTDHHPFDRAVHWLDSWSPQGAAARRLVQHGTSTSPQVGEGHAYLDYDRLQSALDEAAVVVCHGGPATIVEARRHGRLPVVLPRSAARGEHVDDHQVAFTAALARRGEIVLVREERELHEALDRALADPAAFAVEGVAADRERAEAAVARFGRLVDDLLDAKPAGSRRGNLLAGKPVLREQAAATPTGVPAAGQAAADAPVPVLYLGGFGRSGSTLVDRVVGSLPGFCSVGELVHLWERGLLADERCGCGRPFSGCPFWTAVGEAAFGSTGWAALDAHAVVAQKAAVDRNRHIPRLLATLAFPSYRRQLRAYAATLARVYAGVREVSGAAVVVDSSKHASTAFVLRRTPGVRLAVVQVVRDPRGVAHSWGKRVQRPEVTGETDYMPVYSAPRSSLLWLAHNVLFRLFARTGTPAMVLRYEDFLSAPEEQVRRLAAFAGQPAGELPFLASDGSVELVASHNVAGNPMRFRTGRLALRRDDAWRSAMPARTRLLVALLTSPLRVPFGYPLRPGER